MQISQLSPQAKGLIVTLLGVLALTPDTLLVRLADMDSPTLLFWRGINTLFGMSFIIFLQYKKDTGRQFQQIGSTGLAVALIMGLSSCCFVLALYYTSVANTLVIVSGSPMFAALFSYFFLKERIARRTVITMLVVIAAISVIVADTGGRNSILGNCIAIISAMGLAGAFTLMRKGKTRNMVPATALSGVVLIIAGITFSNDLLIPASKIAVIFFMGVSSVVGFALITIGTRYITAPEVSLLMPLETVLGSFLVWYLLAEPVSLAAILGGLIVISALTLHSLCSLKATSPPCV